MNIPEATRLPIKAENADRFHTTAIYSIPEKAGLYRRVSRNGRTGMKSGNGHVVAIIDYGTAVDHDYSLCELVRWGEGEELLRPLLPGVESPNQEQSMPVRPGAGNPVPCDDKPF